MARVAENSSNYLSSIQKTCRVLSTLTDPKRVRLTDIAEAAGLDISTTLRILKELESENFIERDPETKHYSLGPQVYVMHNAMVAGIDIKAAARASLIRLALQFGDTVILSVLTGWESVCVDLCLGDYPIRANYLDVGSRRPLGIGAGSLALLAALPKQQQSSILPRVRQHLKKHYPNYSPDYLELERERTEKQGYAVLLEVVVQKMGGLGKVIYSPAGVPVAALSVAALSERIQMREKELATALTHEAKLIENAWLP
ncbi:MAG: MarR family transcriptional regulator [Burkholderiaceae bacterium]|nr:MarR family transcriptional regulator [Burkholderiaceae bacterium]